MSEPASSSSFYLFTPSAQPCTPSSLPPAHTPPLPLSPFITDDRPTMQQPHPQHPLQPLELIPPATASSLCFTPLKPLPSHADAPSPLTPFTSPSSSSAASLQHPSVSLSPAEPSPSPPSHHHNHHHHHAKHASMPTLPSPSALSASSHSFALPDLQHFSVHLTISPKQPECNSSTTRSASPSLSLSPFASSPSLPTSRASLPPLPPPTSLPPASSHTRRHSTSLVELLRQVSSARSSSSASFASLSCSPPARAPRSIGLSVRSSSDLLQFIRVHQLIPLARELTVQSVQAMIDHMQLDLDALTPHTLTALTLTQTFLSLNQLLSTVCLLLDASLDDEQVIATAKTLGLIARTRRFILKYRRRDPQAILLPAFDEQQSPMHVVEEHAQPSTTRTLLTPPDTRRVSLTPLSPLHHIVLQEEVELPEQDESQQHQELVVEQQEEHNALADQQPNECALGDEPAAPTHLTITDIANLIHQLQLIHRHQLDTHSDASVSSAPSSSTHLDSALSSLSLPDSVDLHQVESDVQSLAAQFSFASTQSLLHTLQLLYNDDALTDEDQLSADVVAYVTHHRQQQRARYLQHQITVHHELHTPLPIRRQHDTRLECIRRMLAHVEQHQLMHDHCALQQSELDASLLSLHIDVERVDELYFALLRHAQVYHDQQRFSTADQLCHSLLQLSRDVQAIAAMLSQDEREYMQQIIDGQASMLPLITKQSRASLSAASTHSTTLLLPPTATASASHSAPASPRTIGRVAHSHQPSHHRIHSSPALSCRVSQPSLSSQSLSSVPTPHLTSTAPSPAALPVPAPSLSISPLTPPAAAMVSEATAVLPQEASAASGDGLAVAAAAAAAASGGMSSSICTSPARHQRNVSDSWSTTLTDREKRQRDLNELQSLILSTGIIVPALPTNAATTPNLLSHPSSHTSLSAHHSPATPLSSAFSSSSSSSSPPTRTSPSLPSSCFDAPWDLLDHARITRLLQSLLSWRAMHQPSLSFPCVRDLLRYLCDEACPVNDTVLLSPTSSPSSHTPLPSAVHMLPASSSFQPPFHPAISSHSLRPAQHPRSSVARSTVSSASSASSRAALTSTTPVTTASAPSTYRTYHKPKWYSCLSPADSDIASTSPGTHHRRAAPSHSHKHVLEDCDVGPSVTASNRTEGGVSVQDEYLADDREPQLFPSHSPCHLNTHSPHASAMATHSHHALTAATTSSRHRAHNNQPRSCSIM